MAKNLTPKLPAKPDQASVSVSPVQTDALPSADVESPAAAAKPLETSVVSTPKKEPSLSKPKKSAGNPGKPVAMLPSAQKLEHLKAAVNAAGGIENLLLILQHVDEAGGRTEVADSIEAYRVLKTVLE